MLPCHVCLQIKQVSPKTNPKTLTPRVNTFSAQFVLAVQHKLRVRLSLLCCNLCLQILQVTPKTKPKTYTFYYKDGSIAAARSSAGGLALLRA